MIPYQSSRRIDKYEHQCFFKSGCVSDLIHIFDVGTVYTLM